MTENEMETLKAKVNPKKQWKQEKLFTNSHNVNRFPRQMFVCLLIFQLIEFDMTMMIAIMHLKSVLFLLLFDYSCTLSVFLDFSLLFFTLWYERKTFFHKHFRSHISKAIWVSFYFRNGKKFYSVCWFIFSFILNSLSLSHIGFVHLPRIPWIAVFFSVRFFLFSLVTFVFVFISSSISFILYAVN